MKKRIKSPFDSDTATRSVVRVGKSRGFVMEIGERNPITKGWMLEGKRLVVTAAHCLPHQPPAEATAGTHERTYMSLLGPLGNPKPSIATECLFVDAVADIAILGEPDAHMFDKGGMEHSNAFLGLVDAAATD